MRTTFSQLNHHPFFFFEVFCLKKFRLRNRSRTGKDESLQVYYKYNKTHYKDTNNVNVSETIWTKSTYEFQKNTNLNKKKSLLKVKMEIN